MCLSASTCLCLCLGSAAGVSASFGEMLLLVAMYFHSNQLSSIIELVCSTLGMKVRQWAGASTWLSRRQPDCCTKAETEIKYVIQHFHHMLIC